MTKWLTSLFMLAVLGGSVVAGVPFYSGEHECPMAAMKDGMDCCAKARARQETPEVKAARLCCAVNCPSSGTTTSTTPSLRVAPLSAASQHPATTRTPFVIAIATPGFDPARGHPQHAPPAYIKHLALLI